ncbi:cytochrome P450 [Mycobacterium sp. ITM-2016-00316]|uniref:cytochrome P450 n=1 Tax=Mycobacterium sp. ITM-2016-00316 TaxID=2099695 RepID=UPI000CF86B93|nr:cytochrome P450 [Mycobacterium sp. ITM-2016-00316]WNG83435.1 cytochrome P450 [Mycobacterium sp. ITM-2016-00316]
MTAPTANHLARILAQPSSYTDETALHTTLAHLRAEAPVSWVDQPGYRPFWAITKHADISDIERDNTTFTNAPRPILITTEADDLQAGSGVSTLIHLDGQQHRKVRAIAADWFRPKAMRALQTRIDELAARYVNDMAETGGECDFVQHIAVKFPLCVIMTLLGIPESDFAFMLKLTQELFGSDDDEYQRPSLEEQGPALMEMFGYFTELTASRRQHPTDDLGSTIANARIDGEPLPDIDTISYYVIVATAGHDTTSATISGGLHALIDNPDQRRALRADPGLQPLATEEMVRWVTPVKAFMRTAARDTTVRGVPIAQGESLLLSYVSANRDNDAFSDPFRFDITRNPNRHLAFGHGVHFCLGAALARMEISSFFAALLPRLTDIELAGTPEHVATTFVGGLKHLPIRCQLTQ